MKKPEDGSMRYAATALQLTQQPALRNAVITLASALAWMVAVAATN
jgi:hypothetical protein